jgi:heterodisulfide reductase subunit C
VHWREGHCWNKEREAVSVYGNPRSVMTIKISPKTIKKDFIEKLAKLSGQNVQQCFQCGTCTASCPMLEKMENVPRKIMHMAQLGLEEKLENSNTCWICASCHTCNVRCPRGVDIPRVMEALRLMTLRKNYIEPSRLPPDIVKDLPQIAMVAGFRKLTS